MLGLLVLAALLVAARARGEPRTARAWSCDGPASRSTCATRTRCERVEPAAGELLHLERKGLDSFVVEPLELPAYQGDVGGILPVVAARELDALSERFPDLEPVEEGKARINQVAGYSLVFRASRSPRALRPPRAAARSPCPARATA